MQYTSHFILWLKPTHMNKVMYLWENTDGTMFIAVYFSCLICKMEKKECIAFNIFPLI